MFAARVKPFEASEMVNPIFAFVPDNLGEPQLIDDVVIVVCETNPKQPPHVLENKSLRTNLSYRPNSFGKKITLVRMPSVFSPDGKWLARGPPKHDLNTTFVLSKVMTTNVPFNNIPVSHVADPAEFVMPKCLARVGIPFKDRLMLITGLGRSKGHSSSADEEFK